MRRLEIARLIPGVQAPHFETENERTGRAPLDVPLVDEISEAPGRRYIAVARIVDPGARPDHPLMSRHQVQLAPGAFRGNGGAAGTGVLTDAAAAETTDRLAAESLADELRGSKLDAGIERDGARLDQRISSGAVDAANPARSEEHK